MSVLNRPVLVLNKMWMPVRVASVRRCLNKIFADKASIIDPADYFVYSWLEWVELNANSDEFVLTTTGSDVKVPEVIVLAKWDKVFIKDPKLTKRNIYIRDRYSCQYTGKQLSFNEANIDHIIPRARGGKNTWENLVVCTREINSRKGDRTPAEAGLKLIRKPVKPVSDGPYKLFDPKFNMPDSWKKFIKVNK